MHLLNRVGEELCEIDRLLVDCLSLLVGACEEEQLLKELLHILRLRANGGDSLIQKVFVLAPPARKHIGVAEDDGERRTQLV